MAKMVIKESELRRYIKKLVQESLENEARQSDESKAEIAKMENGQPYDRSKLEQAGLRREEAYRAKMGYPRIQDWIKQQKQEYKEKTGKSLGSIDVCKVDENGVPQIVAVGKERKIVPVEQMSKARDEIMSQRADAHRDLNRNRWVKNADRENIAKERGVDIDQVSRFDNGINNVENDPHTKMWNSLSDDEKASYAEKIRKQKIDKSFDDNAKFREEHKAIPPSEKHDTKWFINHLQDLKDKRELRHKQLGGERNDVNASEWDRDDYLINDTERILKDYLFDQNVVCKYFGITPEEYQNNEQMWRNAYQQEYDRNKGKINKNNRDKIWHGRSENSEQSDITDKIVANAENDSMDGIDDDFRQTYGDNIVNANDMPSNLRGDDYEPQIDDDEDDGDDRMQDASDMGYFDGLDDFINDYNK